MWSLHDARNRFSTVLATALVRGATVVTGTVGDFAPTGVAVLDPFRC